jgi:RsmE family RNA methyltransferase
LRAQAGDTVRIGLVDGPLGVARVAAIDGDEVRLACELEAAAPPRPGDQLLLAIPRPKVMLRCLEHAAALGFGRIGLLRSWRVDKSHTLSKALSPAVMRERLLRGLAQARRTWLPAVEVHRRFKAFVEDSLPAWSSGSTRVVAHPTAGTWVGDLAVAGPVTLAIGPEGGFIDYEIDALARAGFTAIHCGSHPLRVEAAIPFVFGQLALRRSAGANGAASCP